ncbi:hypothetical protein L596_001203 [Steinernema carpocapsae]|uniref:SAC3/GANP/THP3 conserved domain-containing protein n=1 Tax=Steinernema carpocapsae TaxID=34508 RepID=A0A4U8UN27_STECR|nr:hypothetical protein L596_001203 [Steinernema carpocapsae]
MKLGFVAPIVGEQMNFNGRGSRNPPKRRISGRNLRNSCVAGNFDHVESPDFLHELEALRGRSCTTAEKRYEVLKVRDRILQRLRKHVNGVTAKKLIVERWIWRHMSGPLLERYRRIFQMSVNPFEKRPSGEPDHKFFVTDYSRSAADQEEPLCHELRSPKALVASMDYILKWMCNKPVTTQWYDFVWSRTRAIRKEITQQKIISPEAVGILEKCCRIHIFAAHHFCECSASDFDQQMNNENLTKSLQSLRHIYEDLAKRHIYLDSEAEFRCYDVLLNLRDSNILQQVFKLRVEVQATPEMRLAVNLFLAFNTSNYVRFFRMVISSCSFLQACLLHRWFGELRADTLRTLAVSYSKKIIRDTSDALTIGRNFQTVAQ